MGLGWCWGRHEELHLGHPRRGGKCGSSGITPDLGILGGLFQELSGVEGPLTYGPVPGSPFAGLSWTGWDFLAQRHHVGAGLPGSSPAQRERGAHVPAPGHMFWGKSSEGSEFRELHFLSPLPGPLASVVALGTDSKEEARR